MAPAPIPRSALLLMVLGGALAGAAHATPTDPSLGLHDAAVLPGAPRIVRVDGSFHRDDLVQVPFPLQVLIHTNSPDPQYVLVEPGARRVHGRATRLDDGLQAADVPFLLSGGLPETGTYVVELSERRIDIALPAWFPAGPAQVQLFVWNQGEPVLSNPFPIEVGPAR